jgi:hypothetical protein
MEYSQEEKKTAQAIISNKDFCALLAKVLLSTEETLSMEVVRDKTNEELGEIVRADAIAKEKIQIRWNKLKQLGQSNSGKKSSVPK